jgi:hypothetical protein
MVDRWNAPAQPPNDPSRLRRRRAFWSVCLILAGILGLTGVLELAASRGPLGRFQDRTIAYLDKAERKAAEAFAAGRAINAAASILKSTEVSPIVVKIAPMEVLEPVDDLAKQFSDIMAISIGALLLQRLMLEVSQAWALAILLPAGCALMLAGLHTGRWPGLGLRLSALGRSAILLALFARFVIPVTGWVGDEVTDRFLARDLNDAVSTMNASHGNLAGAAPKDQPVAEQAPSSLWESIEAARSWIPDRAQTEAIVKALESVPDQIVKAIEIFLVQTILTPLTIGLLFYSALRSLVRPLRPDRFGP